MSTVPLRVVPSHTPSSVRLVHTEDVLTEWVGVRDLVLSAMGEGSFSETDVMRFLLSGAWRLWLIERDEVSSVCITEIVDFPRQRKCLLRYAAGAIGDLNEHSLRLEAYAIANGCDVLEMYARRGMERAKPDWAKKYVVLQKELTP